MILALVAAVAAVAGFVAARRRRVPAPARSEYAETLDALARLRRPR